MMKAPAGTERRGNGRRTAPRSTTPTRPFHMKKMKKILFSLLALTLLTLPAAAQDSDHNFKVAKNMDVMNAVYKQLDMMYVDTLDADEVLGNGIKRILNSLDPYTEYYPEQEQKQLKSLLTGKFAGIGAIIRKDLKLNRVVITEPYEGMPAAEAGLRMGDVIVAVDGIDMTQRDQQVVSNHLLGDPGTSVEVKYLRPSTGKTQKLRITRRTIQLPTVPYYGLLAPGTGYIGVERFVEGSTAEVRRAFVELRKQGMKRLVLDLRGNGGGLEPEAVSLVNLFVPKGKTVVENRGKLSRMNRAFKTTAEPLDTVMPMVVLVDGMTASSSEITCGALQDFDRAVIMGTRTYGKGLVQTTTELPYNGSMKLTTHRYYIPSGRCIQAINYKHKGDGSREQVADSLIRTFYTAGGRPVRDGGGIMPDSVIRPDSLTNLVAYLTELRDSNELVLSFERDYIARHERIAAPSEFLLSNQDFDDFKQRVIASGFKYDQMTNKYLADLERLARFEGYYDGAKDEFEALRKRLKPDLAHDLERDRQTLRELLSEQIAANYYYRRGSIELSLRFDRQVKAAGELLNNPSAYTNILHPAK